MLGAMFGVAPGLAGRWGPAAEAGLRRWLAHPKAVAVGGCGLDFGSGVRARVREGERERERERERE